MVTRGEADTELDSIFEDAGWDDLTPVVALDAATEEYDAETLAVLLARCLAPESRH